MDKMDRMLHALPQDGPSPDLSVMIRAAVHRRHRRRQLVRWTGASLLAAVGLWLISPGIAWVSSGELLAPGTPWLLGSMGYLNYESIEMINSFWNGTFSLQNVIGSSLAFSIWLGALLLCSAIFLAVDSQAVQPPPSKTTGGNRSSEMFPSSVHI